MAGSVYRVPLHLHKDRNGMSGSDVWMYRKFMGIVYLLSHLISHNARPKVGKLLHNTQQWEDCGEIIMHSISPSYSMYPKLSAQQQKFSLKKFDFLQRVSTLYLCTTVHTYIHPHGHRTTLLS